LTSNGSVIPDEPVDAAFCYEAKAATASRFAVTRPASEATLRLFVIVRSRANGDFEVGEDDAARDRVQSSYLFPADARMGWVS